VVDMMNTIKQEHLLYLIGAFVLYMVVSGVMNG